MTTLDRDQARRILCQLCHRFFASRTTVSLEPWDNRILVRRFFICRHCRQIRLYYKRRRLRLFA